MTGAAPDTAMVLAAGRGLRMRPLTAGRAKPTLPVLGRPLVARVLDHLAACGVRRFAVNAYHAPETIEQAVRAAGVGGDVRVFREADLMGAGGALAAPRAFLAEASRFALANSDTLCPAPLAAMSARLDATGADGVLLVRRPPHPGYRPLLVDGERVLGPAADEADRRGEPATYLGVAVLSSSILSRVPDDRPSGLFEVLGPSIDAGRLLAFDWDGPWLEMTSPDSYRRRLVGRVLAARGAGRVALPGGDAPVRRTPWGAAFVAPGAEVHPDAQLHGGVVVERGARVGPGAVVADSVVLEDGIVEPLAWVERVVVDRAARVAARAARRDVVIARGEDGSRIPVGDGRPAR
ncbi:MAG: hypothetical protein D6738_03785 [Acidobacteria bacterium]|nr:MAG: hypothetical protein D6738_03785 [Acidobacteriota bacterium]